MPDAIDLSEERLLGRLHEGFPLVQRPFAAVGSALGLAEEDLLEKLRLARSRGELRRFGPIFQLELAPPRFTLVAIAPGEAAFDELAARLWALRSVVLLRRRRHRFGIWLLLACADAAEEDALIDRVAHIASAPLLAFRAEAAADRRLACAEGRLLRVLGSGLPMLPQPYEALAATLGIGAGEVQGDLQRWLDEGLVQRIGALPREPRHARSMSAMSLWDVDGADLAAVRARLQPEGGAAAGRLEHGLRAREHQPPLWPWNLWLAIQGASESDLEARHRRIGAMLAGLVRGEGELLQAWPFALSAAGSR
jgi:DNA-binding Lrp family transcriptional regulator